MKRTAVGALAAALLCLPAIGNGRELAEAVQDAKDEVAGELARCAAYYAIAAAMISVSDAPGPDLRDKGIAQTKQAAETAIGMAAQMSSPAIAAARMDLARQTMQREMKNDWGNFSLIQVKYMWSCKDLVERPDDRFAYWVKEKSKLPDVPPTNPK